VVPFVKWGRADCAQLSAILMLIITKDLKDGVDAHICENMCFTTDELNEVFQYVSQTVFYEIATVKLRCRKICAIWVPRTLTDEHKQN
jgi:hypothetical protein